MNLIKTISNIIKSLNHFSSVTVPKIVELQGVKIIAVRSPFSYEEVKAIYDKCGGDLDKTQTIVNCCIAAGFSPYEQTIEKIIKTLSATPACYRPDEATCRGCVTNSKKEGPNDKSN